MIPKSTIQTTVGLLVIGIVMVLTLIIFTFSILGGAGQQSGSSELTGPEASPTPIYEEFVIPDDTTN